MNEKDKRDAGKPAEQKSFNSTKGKGPGMDKGKREDQKTGGRPNEGKRGGKPGGQNPSDAGGRSKSINDPSFYYPDEVIGKAVASFPFNRPTGMRLGAINVANANSDKIPPVMVINYALNYGDMSDASSAVNIAARAMYAYVRKANSGARNYEASDLMTYFMAMDSIYTYMCQIRRVLGLRGLYAYNNRTLPNALAQAEHIGIQVLQSNYADLLARYNILVDKINRQFAIPKSFKLFLRRVAVASNYFIDHQSITSQFYVMRMVGYFTWTGTQAGGSALKYTKVKANNIGGMLDEVNALVDALAQEDDIALMCGDIIKAYGADNCFSLTYCPEGYVAPIIKDDNVLQQIENINFMTSKQVAPQVEVTKTIGDINQSGNVLTQIKSIVISGEDVTGKQSYYESLKSLASRAIINSYKDTPDWKDCLEFSRLIETYTFDDTNNLLNFECGAEVIVDIDIYGGSQGLETYESIKWGDSFWLDSAPTITSLKVDVLTQAFDWHPCKRYMEWHYDSVNLGTYIGLAMESKVITTVSTVDIAATHDCAALALLDIGMYSVTA